MSLRKLSLFLGIIMVYLLCPLLGFHAMPKFWSNRSNWVRRQRLSSNSAGVTPVVVWGVDLYANKNLLSVVCTVPPNPSNFFIPSLKIRTDLSTKPLDEGCLGVVFTCKISFLAIKSANSSLTNPEPLSETTISGSP